MVARDLKLAEETGGWVHIAHVSVAGSVELIRKAKEKGVHVTAEVTPHHLTMTQEAVARCGTMAKVNPPLRTEKDREALVRALKEGVIDIIATDHAPHTVADKQKDYAAAASGISGFETAFGSLMALVHNGQLTLAELVYRLTAVPAKILGEMAARLGSLVVGAVVDLTIMDPDKEWTVDATQIRLTGQKYAARWRQVEGKGRCHLAAGQVGLRGRVFENRTERGSADGTKGLLGEMNKKARLVLADGSAYEGFSFGAETDGFGEVVFNTSMTGYQEILTDPSYAGQIVLPTYPLIGNYGINQQDDESTQIQVSGFVVREECLEPNHYRSSETLHRYLPGWRRSGH